METDFPIDLVDHSHGSCVVELVNYSKPRGGVSTYEQRFLLYFILGVYLGPDVTSEVPRKSALQREAEGLPPYTSDMLGTVATCQAGPLIGLVDIYECDDAYLFRCSLPGVKKQENEFSCEVEGNGKVTIMGSTTTGESNVYRGSRLFTTLFQSLSPPGPFSVSFCLPGPVEPLSPTANFRNDGILEALVMKQRARIGKASLTFES
eukprot:c24926_g1_i5 orf=287-904(-)